MRPYDLVLLDWDGTLVDSAAWFRAALDRAAQQFGFRRLAAPEFEALRAMSSREILRHLRVPWWQVPRIGRAMRAWAADEVAAGRLQLFAGAAELLAALARAGVRRAIVSSNSEANVRAVLGRELAALVDDYACGAALAGKARLFRTVLRRARCAPGRALAIGDERRDLEAARRAGVAAGAVTWGYADAAALRALQPDHVFERPGDIAVLVVSAAP